MQIPIRLWLSLVDIAKSQPSKKCWGSTRTISFLKVHKHNLICGGVRQSPIIRLLQLSSFFRKRKQQVFEKKTFFALPQ